MSSRVRGGEVASWHTMVPPFIAPMVAMYLGHLVATATGRKTLRGG